MSSIDSYLFNYYPGNTSAKNNVGGNSTQDRGIAQKNAERQTVASQDILDLSSEARNAVTYSTPSDTSRGKETSECLFQRFDMEGWLDEYPSVREYIENRPELRKLLSNHEPARVNLMVQLGLREEGISYSRTATEKDLYGEILVKQYKNANEESFGLYLQAQKEAGKTILEHPFLDSDILRSIKQGSVDEYGYGMAVPESWDVGRGIAVQNPVGNYIEEYPDSPTKPGADGLFHYPCYFEDFSAAPTLDYSDPNQTGGTTITPIDEFGNPVGESRFYVAATPREETTDPVLSFHSTDSVYLPGLTLDERKTFIDLAQTLVNRSGLKDSGGKPLDVLDQSFVFLKRKNDSGSEVLDIYFDQVQSRLSTEDHEKLKNLFSNDKTLSSLAEKSLKTRGNPSRAGDYSVSVTDLEGNALFGDRLRLESNGKSVVVTMEDYRNMSRSQVISYIAVTKEMTASH